MTRGAVAAKDWLPLAVAGATAAALCFGLTQVPEPLDFSAGGALAGVLGQLAVTGPAALLAAAAAALNITAGAVLYGVIRGAPLRSLSETLLGGLVGAVLLDTACLYVLGSLGWFSWPLLTGVLLLVVVAAARSGRLPRINRPRAPGSWWPMLIVISLVWAGPLIVQLASPVVPFGDVLPNHVAPVAHVATFGQFDPLTTTPSPIYGPSRTLLGYVGLLGAITTLTGVPATLSAAAFILPLTLLVAAGIRLLAAGMAGPGLGPWVLLAFALTQPFARLTDDRARIVAIPLAAWTLVELLRATPSDEGAVRERRTTSVGLCLSLGATLLMHPVIGALTAATMLLVTLARPHRHARSALPALAGAALVAIPQATTMLDVPLPGIVAAATFAGGVGSAVLLTRPSDIAIRVARFLCATGIVMLVCALVAGLTVLPGILSGATRWSVDLYETLPLLSLAALVGAVVAARRVLTPLFIAGVAVALLAGAAAYTIPDGTDSTLLRSIRFEVPKTILSWAPVWVAIGAATALSVGLGSMAGYGRRGRWSARGPLLAAASVLFLIFVSLPIREAPIDRLHTGERRLSESLATHLQIADRGFWSRYPDARYLVASDQLALLDVVRAEVRSGAIGPRTPVLHVGRSFQPWSAAPLGVFTGVLETMVSEDAEVSIHTVGGRLHPISELEGLLAPPHPADRFPYVVVEPDMRSRALERLVRLVGYEAIFAGEAGTIYRLNPAPDGD